MVIFEIFRFKIMIRIGMFDVKCEVETRKVAAMEFYLLSFYTLSDYESGKSSKP